MQRVPTGPGPDVQRGFASSDSVLLSVLLASVTSLHSITCITVTRKVGAVKLVFLLFPSAVEHSTMKFRNQSGSAPRALVMTGAGPQRTLCHGQIISLKYIRS